MGGEFDREVLERARERRYLISRAEIMALGGSDRLITDRVASGRWLQRQAGVYQVDARSADWRDRLLAGVLAGGDGTLISHRAALVVWALDGLRSAPVEITAPYSRRPIPKEVIVHRTRRPMETRKVGSLPVTTPDRSLLDAAAVVPSLVVAKALDSALRKRLVTVDSMWDLVATKGGPGVRGTKMMRRLLAERAYDEVAGSPAETELLTWMRRRGIREPELQVEMFTMAGAMIKPDFFWPALGKAVEVDGVSAHGSAESLDHDLQRQNALLELGIELRRFSGRAVRRRPLEVVEEIRRFLDR
ncbi:MAG: type IV toxin-antitoxin system AbiEi family antitoxin domain-containing protein [Acidimicrobiia bacterium]